MSADGNITDNKVLNFYLPPCTLYVAPTFHNLPMVLKLHPCFVLAQYASVVFKAGMLYHKIGMCAKPNPKYPVCFNVKMRNTLRQTQ